MTLTEIAAKVNKSKENEDCVDINEIGNALGVTLNYYDDQDRLKCYWLGNWYCTDTWVGYKIYFLDGNAVAYSSQSGRKCDEQFKWFSTEAATSVRNYIITFLEEDNDISNLEFCNMAEDIGDSYKIDFNASLLSSNIPIYKGHRVSIIEKYDDAKHWGIGTKLKIAFPDGETTIVDIHDLDFKFYVQ